MTSYQLTEYRPQGIAHVATLAGSTVFGLVAFAWTGSILPPLLVGAGAFLQLWKTGDRQRDPHWCHALSEMWTYSLGNPSLEQEYPGWCQKYGVAAVNQIIEPMIGACFYANFANKPDKYPYAGLQGVLVYDCEQDGIPPLTPRDYVAFRLQQREEAIARSKHFVPPLQTVRHAESIAAQPATQQSILVPAVEVMEPDPSITLDSAPLRKRVSEVPLASFQREAEPDVLQFLLSLTQAPLQPTIFVGPPGSGKGTAAAIALRLGKRRNGLRYWVFNPKPSLQEAGYWDDADCHILKNCLDLKENPFAALKEVLAKFAEEGDRRHGIPGDHPPLVLLLEEVNAIVGRLTPGQKQEFKSSVSSLASMLRGANMAIWLSGQSINMEELGLGSRSNRAMFTMIVTVGEDREAVVPICDILGIEFDPASLPGDGRYWITSKGTYLAPPAPTKVRQYTSWAEVPNLVDLRATTTQSQAPQQQTAELTDEELWEDYKQWKGSATPGNPKSDRQWKLQRLGGEGGDKHRKLEDLKIKFGTSTPEPAIA